MATKYADLHADLAADPTGVTPVQAGDYPSGDEFQRDVKLAKVRYSFKGDEVAADVIRLFRAKKGTTILPALSETQVIVDCAATLTVDVGDEDTLAPTPLIDSDADRYCDGIDCGAVGRDAFANGVAATALYTLQSDCWITATLATLVTPTDTGVIDFIIAYLENQ